VKIPLVTDGGGESLVCFQKTRVVQLEDDNSGSSDSGGGSGGGDDDGGSGCGVKVKKETR